MKTLISIVLVFYTVAGMGQKPDTLMIFDPADMNSEGRDFLQLNLDEISYYASQGFISIKRDNSSWCWKNSPDKFINCSIEVKIFKYSEKGIVKSLCLACIQNNRILKLDACVEIEK